MKKTYTCKHCNCEFETITEGRVTCHDCRREIYYSNKLNPTEKSIKICSRCGEEYKSAAKSGRRCAKCKEEVWRLNHVEESQGRSRSREWHPLPTEEGRKQALRRQQIKEIGRLCKGCNVPKPEADFIAETIDLFEIEFKSCTDCRSKNKKYHGLNEKSRRKLYEYYGGKCGSCKEAMTFDSKCHVDHCHSTGKIRRMICQPCNHALGLMRENPERIRFLADYAAEILGQ